MKMSDKAKVMLNRYLEELEKHLPLLKAKDIIRERRSDFMDTLEDQAGADSEISEAEVEALLIKTGAPATVARQYKSNQYLIGPGLFPLFSLVVKIVFSVLGVMALIGVFVFPEVVAPQGIPAYLLSVISGLMTAFGSICLVFFVLQRFVSTEDPDEDWHPSQLSPAEHQEYPGNIPLIVYMAFLLAAGILLNIFASNLSLFFTQEGALVHVPFEITGLVPLVPLLTLVMGLSFVHSGMLLYFKGWNKLTRITDIGLSLVGAVVPLLLFLSGMQVQVREGFEAPGALEAPEIMNAFTQLGRVGLVVIVGACVISAGIKLFRFLRRRRPVC